ncbi:putative repeat protein (TIGR02543 family) [Treponema rectale]|uniref:Putative repeat protein (TIGR02543 family) n=1 Tax=Treponema rectale TaxID=744512 RepID=A0A840SG56_9SPIR|nr:leucine-rich repeat protein [Treponema rectale]MBB5219874.1 putative repeat protein (TIGR02543 family) [Treponema rectale]
MAVLFLGTFSFLSCSSEYTSEEPDKSNISYTVNFDVNGGTGESSQLKTITVKAGTIINLPVVADDNSVPLLTHDEGKMFVAWNTDSNGHGTGYSDGTSLIVTKDITLYAQWAIPHTLTFNANNESETTCTLTVPEDISIKLPESSFTNPGKVLAEWNTESNGTGTSYTPESAATFADDTTLYAIWKTPCTITFNTNGGNQIGDQIVAEGYRVQKPASPEKDGYRFMGWYSDTSFGTEFDFETPVLSDMELFASWKKVITIFYDPNSGDGEIQIQTLLEGEEVTLLENIFTRPDYGFACWNTAKDGSGDRYDDKATFIPEDNITLYAQWGMTCTISFNKGNDNAEGEMEEISLPAGSSIQLPASTFSLEGFYCSGWNTTLDGSGTSYANGQTIILNETTTLYAQWKEGSGIFYSITIPSVEHGSVSSNMTSAMAGSFITLTLTPDEDYKAGSITITCGEENVPLTEIEAGKIWQFAMPDGEISISIDFALKGWKVLYDENIINGSLSTDRDYYLPGEEAVITIVPDETYAYRAESLSVKNSDGEEIEITEETGENGIYYTFTMPTGDVTAYAEFDKLQCKVKFASSITGCDDMPSETHVDMGTQIILPSCTYFYYGTGYTFRNWNSESDGTGDTYTAETSLIVNDDITFWAQCDSGYITSVAELSTLLGKIKAHSLTSAKIIITDAKTSDVTGSTASSISPVGQHLASYSSVKVALTLNQNANLTSIGNYAFYYRSNLTSVSMPSNITSIGAYAFYNCSYLTSANLPASATSIGNYAFYNCSSLSGSISIPSGVKTIGSYAFCGCSYITYASVPSGVTAINDYTFSGCSSMTGVSLPSGITSIGSYAFSNCKLSSITIPNGTKSIGSHAFDGCSSASTLEFDSSNTLTSLGSYAFFNCSKLQTVTIPYTVTALNEYTFSGCSKLTGVDFPSGMTTIGTSAFKNCTALYKITLPSSLTAIGGSAFEGCTKLYSGNSFPLTLPSALKTIGASAFRGCSANFMKITIPASVTSIGSSAFSDCSELTTISFDSSSKLTDLGGYAFENCIKLTKVSVPDSVTSMGSAIFTGCKGLTEISLPFLGTSESMPIFFGSLFGTQSYTGGSKTIQYGDIENSSDSNTYYIPNVNTVSVSRGKIRNGAFSECNNVTAVNLGSGVTSIGIGAFYGTNVSKLIIPDSVTYMGNAAFGHCQRLTSITLPYLDYNFGYYFTTKAPTGSDATWYRSIVQNTKTYYIDSNLSTITINSFKDNKIPDYAFQNMGNTYTFNITTNKVTYVGKKAFANAYSKFPLQTFLNNGYVTTIGEYAFTGNEVVNLTIPSTVTVIGEGAFSACTKLESYTSPFIGGKKSPGVSSSYDLLFGYVFGTDSYTGGTAASQRYIDNGSYKTYYIPSDLVKVKYTGTGMIRYGTFMNCTTLEKVQFDDATSIGSYAFYGCSSLGYDSTHLISITETVTSIGDCAFKDCTSLYNVTIGENVTRIGKECFTGCSKLGKVYFYAAKQNWYYTTNSDYTGGSKSKVLSGESYKQDWDNFAKCFRSDKDWQKYLYWKQP